MIYQVRHLTTYCYEKPVSFARCVLRLRPHEGAGQRLLSHDLTITPKPVRQETHIGQFGETVVTVTIDQPHKELKVLAESQVAVERPALPPGLVGQPWEQVREESFAAASLDLTSPAHFLYPTAMTPLAADITDYAAKSFTPGRPLVEAGFDLACRIKAEFDYDPKATDVSTPPGEAFRERAGVCQDFAHIMICGLRGLGLPAAYVSGYLRTIPPPGRPRMQGADATHAWVMLHCGRSLGWVGFDPTNALVVAGDHIILAIGRDYADVAPIGGVLFGSGDQELKVGVDVIPADELPGEAAA